MFRSDDEMVMRAASNLTADQAAPATLIDALLTEQRSLTASATFARWHEDAARPLHATHYHDLLPFHAPRPGQQYAFEVNLDQCSGCKACVTACHALNGLDDDETWRSVGLLVSPGEPVEEGRGKRAEAANARVSDSRLTSSSAAGFQQHITTACHHCLDPGCLNGCPVLAYEKDPDTGIVRHLDDQCIGCQYCLMKCPYDAPKYSERLGIVRKCDLCAGRLAEAEAPACVQACPNAAIRITLANTAEIRAQYEVPATRKEGTVAWGTGKGKWESGAEQFLAPTFSRARSPVPESAAWSHGRSAMNRFLPGAAEPSMPLPTTRYVSAKNMPADLVGADHAQVRLQPAHLPLVWMLVLTQAGAGSFAMLPFSNAVAQPAVAIAGLAAATTGLLASLFHLGKPCQAWRAFLGWRTSWLSREILAFGGFIVLAGGLGFTFISNSRGALASILAAFTASSGLYGVFCSGMVYHDTGREFWRGTRSIGKFFASAASLGALVAWWASERAGLKMAWLPGAVALLFLVRLRSEFVLLRHCPDDADLTEEVPKSLLGRSALLLRFRLGKLLRAHLAAAWIGGVALPAIGVLLTTPAPGLAAMAAAIGLTSEFIERALFFRAVLPLKMPGGVVV